MDFGLSVLDVSPVSSGSNGARALRNTLELARFVDRLGYERYWLAEHHNLPSIASSAPEIMIGHVANVTERIRVGAGTDHADRPHSHVMPGMSDVATTALEEALG